MYTLEQPLVQGQIYPFDVGQHIAAEQSPDVVQPWARGIVHFDFEMMNNPAKRRWDGEGGADERGKGASHFFRRQGDGVENGWSDAGRPVLACQ